ncbi:glycosyltransferase family 4 protein [Psychroserpens jangbogonensis]|uniref:glycosyltransferase family 4 protein n=1 Tax=Psychroserpens jangbogonensis TaxID=1484460 RepID=UPI00053EB9FE|nr:glycosyltransferase family 4 protein [Psychroserpens jangbogonensis]
MNNKLKIAIYSGVIPSSTFIERLIIGLASSNTCEIYLFGAIQNESNYDSNVKFAGYKNIKWHKTIHLIKYSAFLFFFRRKDKKKLDSILKSQKRNTLLDKVKFYPVLWHKPDIFHLQWAKGLKDWIWVQEFGIKVVLSLRGTQINLSPIANKSLADMYKANFPKVDAFHAVSKAIALEAEKYVAQKEKIKVVYSGLNLESIKHVVEKENSILKMLSIGRPHWIKGYTYALDACKILKDKGCKFEYTIIGAAGNIELAYQIKDLNLQSEIVLLHRKPFDTVQKLIEDSNLLVLPSLKEGIANVVLEAMLLHTLVLTTDCGGITEVIVDNHNGFVAPIRDSEKLAEKIMEITKMPSSDVIRITQNALKTVKAQHNEQQMITGMLKLYQNL